MKKKQNNKTNNEVYSVVRNAIKATGRPGRRPSKLGNTMRILNIGDGFTYPFTSGSATFNVHRAARTYGYEMATTRTDKGIFAVRCA